MSEIDEYKHVLKSLGVMPKGEGRNNGWTYTYNGMPFWIADLIDYDSNGFEIIKPTVYFFHIKDDKIVDYMDNPCICSSVEEFKMKLSESIRMIKEIFIDGKIKAMNKDFEK